MSQTSSHLTVGAHGRIVIPAPIRKKLGLKQGSSLSLIEKDGKIEIQDLAVELQQIQDTFKSHHWKEGEPFVSDQLIAERHAEALREGY